MCGAFSQSPSTPPICIGSGSTRRKQKGEVMRSRDGLALVNQVLQEDAVTRRTFLQQLGWAGVATLGGLGLAQVRPAFGQQVRRGGTIKLGIGENIDTLDPHQTTIITAVAIHNNIYNGLLKIAYDGS